MNKLISTAALLAALAPSVQAQDEPVTVTVDNFIRAESDAYFAAQIRLGALGSFFHYRDLAPLDNQAVVRLNRDTLYSSLVADLDAGPVTITMPDPGDRFMSLMVLNEDHYVTEVDYGAGTYTFDKESIGTRYVLFGVRTLVNPADPADLDAVHALQDAIKVEQAGTGTFEIPNWDADSQTTVRNALIVLANTLPDFSGAFGNKDEVDPIRHLLGSAAAWGGNPDKDAFYLNIYPEQNDGTTVYNMSVGDVPVDGFWSISVYTADGYYQENEYNAYTLNSVTAVRGDDGGVNVQFGGCDGVIPNCLPITEGWNYMVRLYRPQAEILDGTWTFPVATPAG